jgi:hypothetical protein
MQINGLKVSANIQHDESFLASKLLDLFPRSKMVILAIDFPGSGRPAIVEHQLFQVPGLLGIKAFESGMQRPFPDAGRARKDDHTSHNERELKDWLTGSTRKYFDFKHACDGETRICRTFRAKPLWIFPRVKLR